MHIWAVFYFWKAYVTSHVYGFHCLPAHGIADCLGVWQGDAKEEELRDEKSARNLLERNFSPSFLHSLLFTLGQLTASSLHFRSTCSSRVCVYTKCLHPRISSGHRGQGRMDEQGINFLWHILLAFSLKTLYLFTYLSQFMVEEIENLSNLWRSNNWRI